jgi:rhodanese-related sulfurtransferase
MLERDERIMVVDVRKQEDHAEGSIPGSVNFDAYDALHAGDQRTMEELELPEACEWSPCATADTPARWPRSSCGGRDTRRSTWRVAWKLGRASDVTVNTLRLNRSLSGGCDLGYGVNPAVRVA